jgi:hypothetical protein
MDDAEADMLAEEGTKWLAVNACGFAEAPEFDISISAYRNLSIFHIQHDPDENDCFVPAPVANHSQVFWISDFARRIHATPWTGFFSRLGLGHTVLEFDFYDLRIHFSDRERFAPRCVCFDALRHQVVRVEKAISHLSFLWFGFCGRFKTHIPVSRPALE